MLALLSVCFAGAFPDLLAPAGAAAPSSDAAVIIGLEDYGFLPDVPFARRDAMAVRTMMTTSMGIAPERVRLLTTGNREQILAAIHEATTQAGTAGKVVLWFSGHGATSPIDNSMLLVGDDAKAQQDAFAARSVSVAELEGLLPKGSLVVVDACAAGRGRDGVELLPGVRFAVPSYASQSGGLRVWTAASPTELAEPYPEAKHGLFTAFAVGALRGWGDANEDGVVSLMEAQAYVQRALSTLDARQTPRLQGDDLILSRATEASPDLTMLPPPGKMAPPQSSVVGVPLGNFQKLSSLPPALKASFKGPYRSSPNGGFVDSNNLTLSVAELADAERSDSVNRLASARSMNYLAMNVGAGAFVGGGALLYSGAVLGGVDSTLENQGNIYLIGGSVLAIGGAALAATGFLGLKRNKDKLLEAANQPYEEAP